MAAGVLGLLLAVVVAVVAIAQISALQDVAEPLVGGALLDLIRVPTFFMLLLVFPILAAAVAAPIIIMLKR